MDYNERLKRRFNKLIRDIDNNEWIRKIEELLCIIDNFQNKIQQYNGNVKIYTNDYDMNKSASFNYTEQLLTTFDI